MFAGSHFASQILEIGYNLVISPARQKTAWGHMTTDRRAWRITRAWHLFFRTQCHARESMGSHTYVPARAVRACAHPQTPSFDDVSVATSV